MNIKALKRTRDYLAAHPKSYSQGLWAHPCGTPACVAGFACAAHGGEFVKSTEISKDGYGVYQVWYPTDNESDEIRISIIEKSAQELLGLTDYEKRKMFDGSPFFDSKELKPAPTVQDAIEMLDFAIKTGTVEWNKTSRERWLKHLRDLKEEENS